MHFLQSIQNKFSIDHLFEYYVVLFYLLLEIPIY